MKLIIRIFTKNDEMKFIVFTVILILDVVNRHTIFKFNFEHQNGSNSNCDNPLQTVDKFIISMMHK